MRCRTNELCNFGRLFLIVPLLISLHAAGVPCNADDPLASDISALAAKLASPNFDERQQSIGELRKLSNTAAGVESICQLLRENPHPDAARRLIELLGLVYTRGSFRDETVLRASVALEEAAKSELWFVSEAGNEILKNATTQRVSIAIARLTTLGVPMEPQDPDELFQNAGPAVGFRADPTSNHHLKIYVDEHWPDSPQVFELLEQLRVLAGSLRIGAGRISIYQIDGHPLPPEKIARLKALYGDLRVQERGRVCLGIVQGTMFGENLQGVLVSQVDPKSSAGEAGLRQNDVITRIDEKELIDFNDLVEELRSYRIGDVVTLKVIRNGVQANRTVVPQPPPLNPPPEQPSGEEQLEIKVTLKGWYDPAILNKKADATQKPESTAVE